VSALRWDDFEPDRGLWRPPRRLRRLRLVEPPRAAIAAAGAPTSAASATSVSSYNLVLPTGILDGDLIVILAATGTASLAAITATGYAIPTGGDVSNSTIRMVLLSKVGAVADSGATVAVTHSVAANGVAIARLYRGVDQTTPWDVAVTSFASANGVTTATLPNLTTVTDQCLLIVGAGARVASGTIPTLTPGANYTSAAEANTGGGTGGSNADEQLSERTAGPVAIGTYGGDTITSSQPCRLPLLHAALRPAAAPVGPFPPFPPPSRLQPAYRM
jgi:hypothetical protein